MRRSYNGETGIDATHSALLLPRLGCRPLTSSRRSIFLRRQHARGASG